MNSAAAPSVTAIVVTYQSLETVSAALEALAPAHEQGLAEVIVVDNASDDGTADRVAERYPWVRLVRSGRNLGYGRGCNLGFTRATTPYVLFMNPDVEIEHGDLRRLVRFMEEHPRAGLAGPALRHPEGGLQHAGGLLTPGLLIRRAMGRNSAAGRIAIEPGSPPFTTDWICGAAMIARREAMAEVGGFDPRFFLYFEETDLCVRMRQRGYTIWAVGEAVARHARHASARKVAGSPVLRGAAGDRPGGLTGGPAADGCIGEHFYRSRYYFLRKHHGAVAAALSEGAELLVKALIDVARLILQRKPGARGSQFRERIRAPLWSVPELIDE